MESGSLSSFATGFAFATGALAGGSSGFCPRGTPSATPTGRTTAARQAPLAFHGPVGLAARARAATTGPGVTADSTAARTDCDVSPAPELATAANKPADNVTPRFFTRFRNN